MKKIVSILVIIIAVLLVVVLSSNDSGNKVKVGVLLPLSGTSSLIGENAKKGIELALKNNKAENLQIIFEDNKNDPKEALSSVKRLIDIEKVDLIFTTMSGASLSILPVAKENNIPVIASVVFVDIPGSYSNSFQVYMTDESEAKALVNFVNKTGVKSIGIIYPNNDYGLAIKNSVQKQLSPSVRIVADDTYLLNESSFRTQLIKMKAKGPELLYFVAYPQNLSALLRESKELGINSKLVTNSIMYANGQIGSDPIFEETYATVPTYYLDKNKQISFLEKFGTKYPAGNVYIPYDVINLVAANLQDFDKNNFVKNIIEAGRFESDINGVIEINKTTQKANYDLSVVKILPGGEISSE